MTIYSTWVALVFLGGYAIGGFRSSIVCQRAYESDMLDMARLFGEAIRRSGPECARSVGYHLNAVRNEAKQRAFEQGIDVDGWDVEPVEPAEVRW